MEIPFEQQSMRNEPPPTELCGTALLAYLSSCYMYEQYHANKINRDDGSKLKKQIIQALHTATKSENQYDGMWKRIETAAREYALNSTIENADMFYAAVYNLPDDWRLKR